MSDVWVMLTIESSGTQTDSLMLDPQVPFWFCFTDERLLGGPGSQRIISSHDHGVSSHFFER